MIWVVFVNSLQSEFFLLSGLYQFGLHEAQAIKLAKKSKRQFFWMLFLLEGINWYRNRKIAKAEAPIKKQEPFSLNLILIPKGTR
jgi:hypothetical protein